MRAPLSILLLVSLSVACNVSGPSTPASDAQPNIANPASIFCEANAGRLELRTSADGSVAGICIFQDGTECDEWAFFRGECGPATAGSTPASPTPALVPSLTLSTLMNAEYTSPDWGTYTLIDGVFHRPSLDGSSSEAYTTRLLENTAFGDLDGDNVEDAVVVLATQNGGTGHFIELAAVLNRRGSPQNVATTSLGDRVAVEGITIEGGLVTLSMRVHGPNDGLCCPSQQETWKFALTDGGLIRV